MDFNNVIIFDDFFELETVNAIRKNMLHTFYTNEHKSLGADYEDGWFFSNLLNNNFFEKDQISIIEKKINKKILVSRNYINCMSFSSESAYHIDCDLDNSYTILYFINGPKNTKEADEYGGYFYYKHNNQINCVEPIHNRLIIFPSTFLHRAGHYRRFIKKKRYSIAWKTVIE